MQTATFWEAAHECVCSNFAIVLRFVYCTTNMRKQ